MSAVKIPTKEWREWASSIHKQEVLIEGSKPFSGEKIRLTEELDKLSKEEPTMYAKE